MSQNSEFYIFFDKELVTSDVRQLSWILVQKCIQFDRQILLARCNPTDF